MAPSAERRLRVLFLPPIDWPMGEEAPGGSDPLRVRRLLAEHGVDAEVINPSGRWLNPLRGNDPALQGLDPWRTLRVLFTRRRVDAVVSVFESSGLGPALLRRLVLYRPKVVLWDASVGSTWRVARLIQRLGFPRYDAFLMLTSVQRDYLLEHHRRDADVRLLYYNVDEEFFHPRHSTDGEAIVSVGEDTSRDYPTLLAAVADLDAPLRIKTRWRPDDNAPLCERVSWISERLDDDAFRGLYGSARIVALPLHASFHPGGITTLFEAMAMGKPIVVSDSPVIRDFVRHQREALVVPCKDAEAFAGALRRLLKDRELAGRLGRAARQRIDEEFSTDALARRMADHLRAVLS